MGVCVYIYIYVYVYIYMYMSGADGPWCGRVRSHPPLNLTDNNLNCNGKFGVDDILIQENCKFTICRSENKPRNYPL